MDSLDRDGRATAALQSAVAYLVEAYLDPWADQAVRRLWVGLAQAGISDSNLRNRSRAHLTLATSEALDVEAFRDAMRRVGEQTAFPLRLARVARFPGGRETLYLAPDPSEALGRLHAALVHAVLACGGMVGEWQRPGAWVPHVSLARRLRPEQAESAEAWILARGPVIEARVVRIGLLRDRPIVDLCHVPLRR